MKPPPNTPFLASLERVRRRTKPPRWRDRAGRFYEWDALHEELEVYTARGGHLGSVDVETGVYLKPAVKGRRIDV